MLASFTSTRIFFARSACNVTDVTISLARMALIELAQDIFLHSRGHLPRFPPAFVIIVFSAALVFVETVHYVTYAGPSRVFSFQVFDFGRDGFKRYAFCMQKVGFLLALEIHAAL